MRKYKPFFIIFLNLFVFGLPYHAFALEVNTMTTNNFEHTTPLLRVLLITTGGTIAQGKSGTLNATDLIAQIPALKDIAQIEVDDFIQTYSAAMTPEIQFKLAQHINTLLSTRSDLAGIVITHGTDSLEETAFMLDLLMDDPRPIVFTAAQRTPDTPDSDGPRNLEYAFRTVGSKTAQDKGVMVVLNEDIHSARFVKKTHTSAIEAFKSGKKGMIGTIDNGTVIFYNAPLNRLTIPTQAIEPNVDLIKLAVGDNGKFIHHAIKTQTAGLVIEAFGRGNMPLAVTEAVLAARQAGLIVVVTSRTGEGRVEISNQLKQAGVIAGEDLDGLKARILLITALGATRDIKTIQHWFNLAGGVRTE